MNNASFDLTFSRHVALAEDLKHAALRLRRSPSVTPEESFHRPGVQPVATATDVNQSVSARAGGPDPIARNTKWRGRDRAGGDQRGWGGLVTTVSPASPLKKKIKTS